MHTPEHRANELPGQAPEDQAVYTAVSLTIREVDTWVPVVQPQPVDRVFIMGASANPTVRYAFNNTTGAHGDDTFGQSGDVMWRFVLPRNTPVFGLVVAPDTFGTTAIFLSKIAGDCE